MLRLVVIVAAALLAPAAASAQVATPDAPGTTVTGPSVSATGVATIAGSAVPPEPRTLTVGVEVRTDGSDIPGAFKEVDAKIAAVRAALARVGVPDSAVRLQHFNIYPQYGPPPMKESAPVPPTKVLTGYLVSETLQVEASGRDQLATAMAAAIAAGATSVNTFVPDNPQGQPPDTDALAAAVAQATGQAKALAQAAAQAAGVRLGRLRSLTVEAPSPFGAFGPELFPRWRVQVAVTYDVAS